MQRCLLRSILDRLPKRLRGRPGEVLLSLPIGDKETTMHIRVKPVSYLLLVGLLVSPIAAQTPVDVWGSASLEQYARAEREGERLQPPEIVEVEKMFEAAKTEKVECERLERLTHWDEKGVDGIREHAQALLLLLDIRANDPGQFRRRLAAFMEAFPASKYTVSLASPKRWMRVCPSCNGRSNRTVNCSVCKNTERCPLCNGSGKRTLRGMSRTRIVSDRVGRRYDGESDDDRDFTYRSRSSTYRTGSHATNNYRGTVRVVDDGNRDIPCHKCRGTGECLACLNARRVVTCDACKNQGVVADNAKLAPAILRIAEKGYEAAKGVLPETRVVWDQTQSAQRALHALRTLDEFEAVRDALQALIVKYPKCAQRNACERLLACIEETHRDHQKAKRKAEAEQRLVDADTRALAEALVQAQRETGVYRRRERLIHLRTRYPKASNYAKLEAALELCKADIEREESAVRNALRLLESVESPKIGLEQANKIIQTMDPISPLMGTVQSIRADFIEQQRKADRNQRILYVVVGLIVLLVVYFLFDLLHGIWQTRRHF